MKPFRVLLLAFTLLSLPPVLAQAQDNSDAYYKAGNTLYGQKNYDQAIRYYQAAVQVNPNKWEAEQGMGNCYYAKGDKSTALTHYQKALAINPNNTQLSAFVQSLQAQVGAQPAVPGNGAATSTSNPAPATSVVNKNLPKEGHIVLEIEESDWIGSWADIEKLFPPGSFSSSSTPIGVQLGLGASYVFSPNVQIGVRLQGLLKQPEVISDAFGDTITFNENAIGGSLVGEVVFPISDGINFLGSLQAGFYTMVGSSLTSSSSSSTIDLAASGPGGKISAGVELLMDSNKSWALDISACYQMLSFSPITETLSGPGGGSATLKNDDGSDASMDFSGPGLSAGVRFF